MKNGEPAPEPAEQATAGRKPARAADPSPVRCSCGNAVPTDAVFCPRCGVRVGATPARFRLVKVTPEGDEPCHDILREELIIGKDAACDAVVTGDDYLSRRHARISRSDGLFFVEDLRSANGTSLRVHRPIVLEAGDEIVLGTTVLRFEEIRELR